ncbi:dienelactone hydrolase family protein [Phormidesmis priestleyi ULC007]|uniref:Dienelactone hydrolase family protein n=1 Tax=Phormidesmis priestleyi ULC007 TaxID=1920490 RepID=A0A2T1DK16_9CYAN|nr:dienelactone hydrolase family protein [Phormidesmis priestleyi]PSB20837.1 dienelactone hydrolase family protein [Phormidesmis priestleyi ULC007]PZO51792.1 MAG: dienelactone hydrolase family protein [Phormidesmis priestleyi]
MTEIRTTNATVLNGALQIDAYLAEPTDSEPHPAIVVIQEIFGVNAHIRQVTERLAREGYVAIAPAIFQRTAPGFEVGYSEAETKLGRVYKDQTKADELLSDMRATIAYLETLPWVEKGAIGAIGFCFGGHVAYLAATLPEIKATASFYGAGIAAMTPGGGAPTISRTGEIKGTLYAFFGTEDPLIPVEQIDQIEAELQRQQSSHQVFRYPVGHGFFCDQRSDYRPEAAADAWNQVKALFKNLRASLPG